MLRAATVGFALLLIGISGMAAARADEGIALERAGWWVQARPKDPLAAPPRSGEEPKSGLVVSFLSQPGAAPVAGVNQPVGGTTAYSAVRFKVPDGWTGTLTLASAVPPGASTAALAMCSTTDTWESAEAGPWATRPGVDLSQCTPGEAAANGSTVSFAIGNDLTRHGVLDVAVVPAPSATTPFSVRFDIPTASSLAARNNAGPVGAPPSAPEMTTLPSPSLPTSESAGGQMGAVPTGPLSTVAAGQQSVAARPQTGGATAMASTSPARAEPASARGGFAALVLLGVIVPACLWLSKLRRGTSTNERGVGRFTAVRTAPPSALQ